MNIETKVKYIKKVGNRNLILNKARELYKINIKTDNFKYYLLSIDLDGALLTYDSPSSYSMNGIFFSKAFAEDKRTLVCQFKTFFFRDITRLKELDTRKMFPNMWHRIIQSTHENQVTLFRDDFKCFFITVSIDRYSYIEVFVKLDKTSFPFKSTYLRVANMVTNEFIEDILENVCKYFKERFGIDKDYWKEKEAIR